MELFQAIFNLLVDNLVRHIDSFMIEGYSKIEKILHRLREICFFDFFVVDNGGFLLVYLKTCGSMESRQNTFPFLDSCKVLRGYNHIVRIKEDTHRVSIVSWGLKAVCFV